MQVKDFYFVNFKDFFGQILELSQKIANSDEKQFDYVIAINRGGAVSARFLSDLLAVPMGAFAMASYVGVNLHKELKITQELNLDLKDKQILLVDEICDTGNTFVKAIEYLAKFEPKRVVTASLIVKSGASYQPDFWVEQVDKWVVFPYEIRETLSAIIGQNPAVVTAVNSFFLDLGVDQAILDAISKNLPQKNKGKK